MRTGVSDASFSQKHNVTRFSRQKFLGITGRGIREKRVQLRGAEVRKTSSMRRERNSMAHHTTLINHHESHDSRFIRQACGEVTG